MSESDNVITYVSYYSVTQCVQFKMFVYFFASRVNCHEVFLINRN